MNRDSTLRRLARELGLTHLFLRLQLLRATGLIQSLRLIYAKRNYLSRILEASPIHADENGFEVHMLIQHERCIAGLWALYSFAYFSRNNCSVVIHSDGSLTQADEALIRRLFPTCRIISREVSDAQVIASLEAAGLSQCAALRRNFTLSLKLFDPIIFAAKPEIILLDSDVLFYSEPHELISSHLPTEPSVPCYSVDNGYRYDLSPSEFESLLGRDCIPLLNSGLLRFSSGQIDFERIERYLRHPGLMLDGKAKSHYTELTLFAMEFTLADARPLPESYAICAPDPGQYVAGHYCGGGYWASLFYTRGIPYIARTLFAK